MKQTIQSNKKSKSTTHMKNQQTQKTKSETKIIYTNIKKIYIYIKTTQNIKQTHSNKYKNTQKHINISKYT